MRYLNDSKATNVGAAVAALAGLGPLEHVLLLAGGLAKGADLSPLRAAARGLKQALLFGTDAPQLAELLAPVCSVQRVASLDVAVAEAALRAVPGDTVLEVKDRKVALTTKPYRGAQRMTLTYPTLDQAKALLWIVTGEEKRDALSGLLGGDREIPAGRVSYEESLVIADQAAVG